MDVFFLLSKNDWRITLNEMGIFLQPHFLLLKLTFVNAFLASPHSGITCYTFSSSGQTSRSNDADKWLPVAVVMRKSIVSLFFLLLHRHSLRCLLFFSAVRSARRFISWHISQTLIATYTMFDAYVVDDLGRIRVLKNKQNYIYLFVLYFYF